MSEPEAKDWAEWVNPLGAKGPCPECGVDVGLMKMSPITVRSLREQHRDWHLKLHRELADIARR